MRKYVTNIIPRIWSDLGVLGQLKKKKKNFSVIAKVVLNKRGNALIRTGNSRRVDRGW